jgi:hypothetical protein
MSCHIDVSGKETVAGACADVSRDATFQSTSLPFTLKFDFGTTCVTAKVA